MKEKFFLSLFVFLIVIGASLYLENNSISKSAKNLDTNIKPNISSSVVNPLNIVAMRQKNYTGSDIKIEQESGSGSNYKRYIASYLSEGLKIYALLTIPEGERPKDGWPLIIFNHGYIPPEVYKTTERYIAYMDGFARNGYIVFKPDYRGNGQSEGNPEGAYYSPAYTTDVLNALASVKKYPGVDSSKIGMWGHSMGGNITLRAMVISKDIKVGVIWGGVVGTYDDLINNWHRKVPYQPSQRELSLRNRNRAELMAKYGTPKTNPDFWNAMDPNYFLQDISGPLQLDAGLSDEEVPWEFSQGLNDRLKSLDKTVEFYTYPGADHNISSPSFEIALQRSIDFFNKYLKGV